MSTRHLLTLTRRSHRPLTTTTRLHSTAAVAAEASLPPPSMLYDHISSQVNSKLKRLQNPNPNYLKHNTPHPTLTNHTPILTFPSTHLTTLPTGLRVASEANLASRTATVGAWIASGSRFETRDATHGVAHFVQHMFLKGTYNRKIRELEKEVENMGGHLYGYTGRENTSVYMKVMARDVAKAIEILADVVQDSEFHEWLIKPTRKDLLREIEEVAKDPEEVIFDHLHATAFQHTPLGRSILGPAENIQKITRKDMQDYVATHFTPHRMVISASGAVKHEDLVEQVKKLFTKLSVNPLTTTQLVEKEPAIFTGSEIRMRDDDAPLAHFAVAFNGASSTDPDSVALMVMQEMLGSWKKSSGAGKHMGSQLAQLVGISELAESMTTFNTNYKDTGLFGVYAVAKPDCLDDLAFAIMQEISKLCYRVNDEDVIRAQNQLKSSLLLNLDGSFHTADEIGRQLISYGRRIPFIEMFARIDAVDAATIKRVANRFIFDQDIAIAASGSVKLLPDYNWFRRRTYMLRY